MNLSIFKLIRSIVLVLFVAVSEYKRGSFTFNGAIVGFFLCTLVAYANIVFLLVMLSFSLCGSFSTRYKFNLRQTKINEDDRELDQKRYKKTARDHLQVLSNGVIAFSYAILYCWKTDYSGVTLPIDSKYDSSIYSIGFLATIACCCGDTLASDLGSVIAKSNPRLITNLLRVVPVGTNGAISLEGCIFSFLGGIIIGISYVFGNLIFCRWELFIDTIMINMQSILYCGLFGLLGSTIDSLLGATLQFSGFDREQNVTVQRPGSQIEQISGRNILSNNQVNLISSLITSLIAVYIMPKVL